MDAWPERIAAVNRRQVEEAARLVLQDHALTALLIAGHDEAAIGAAAPGPAVPGTSAVR